MEDLIPFLIFIVIALVNVGKFIIEKGGVKKRAPQQRGEAPTAPSSFQDFIEDLAEKLAPKPTELPDWPEGMERPDYMHEMEEFQHETDDQPAPEEAFSPVAPPERIFTEAATIQTLEHIPAASAPAILSSSAFSGTNRLPSIPMMRSSTARTIDFDLTDRKKLKQAILASLIFSPPRAYNATFDNSLAK